MTQGLGEDEDKEEGVEEEEVEEPLAQAKHQCNAIANIYTNLELNKGDKDTSLWIPRVRRRDSLT